MLLVRVFTEMERPVRMQRDLPVFCYFPGHSHSERLKSIGWEGEKGTWCADRIRGVAIWVEMKDWLD